MTGVYLASTTLLAEVVGLPFELALALGFVLAVSTHFTLQRYFVWIHETGFALRFHHQLQRYLVVVAIQYGLTAAATAVLPEALHVATEVVYLSTAAVLTLANFLVFRGGIFHPATDEDPAGAHRST